jgi:hypothetical protein
VPYEEWKASDEFRRMLPTASEGGFARELILLTLSGYLMLVSDAVGLGATARHVPRRPHHHRPLGQPEGLEGAGRWICPR